jgi:hypothetical protein
MLGTGSLPGAWLVPRVAAAVVGAADAEPHRFRPWLPEWLALRRRDL